MQRKIKGLATALLCVVSMLISGCSGSVPVYMAGLESETVAAAKRSEPVGGMDGSMADDSPGGTDPSGEEPDALAAAESGLQTELPAGYIYVCGAVNAPGVYPIHEDMRVYEAIALAGGFSEQADIQWLNQAEAVHDGQRLYVFTLEETQNLQDIGVADGAAALDGGSETVQGDGRVNLNTASRSELMTLPGIGETKADAIVQYREEHGAFQSIEEIQNISGIKSGVFEKIKDLITI